MTTEWCLLVMSNFSSLSNTSFVCTGKPKNMCDLLYSNTLWQWSRTRPSVSQRYDCIIFQITIDLPLAQRDMVRKSCVESDKIWVDRKINFEITYFMYYNSL